ncbi:DUF4177 domain-containing protein [uncultured Clostridium sp.]|uniref:DUF4177 domain-containing protein n=1 Tax=uncultured Clostridium sp. TaxID=59620 RepID=UPI0028E97E7B|nr:DUF4177 domain-containing protein [uncultured Clostridium sp.]
MVFVGFIIVYPLELKIKRGELMHMKWEYKVFELRHFLSLDKNSTIEEELNKYGEDGWELVGVLQKPYTTLGNPPKLDSDSIVFKKAVVG